MPMFRAKNVALNGACIALDARPPGWECVRSANNASLSLKAGITPISSLVSTVYKKN